MKALPIIPRALALRDVESAIDHYRDEAGGSVAIGFVEALQRMLRDLPPPFADFTVTQDLVERMVGTWNSSERRRAICKCW